MTTTQPGRRKKVRKSTRATKIQQDPRKEVRKELQKKVLDTLQEWGKIGLLVDDASDAEGRIAAEVYGTDTLPKWWITCNTVADGVDCAQALMSDIEAHRGYFVVVVDRYLPVETPTERPQDWRAETADPNSACTQLYNTLVELQDLAKEGRGHVILVTSFPRDAFKATSDALPPFHTRTANPLDETLRNTELFHRHLDYFGPVMPADLRANANEGKAKNWWSSVQAVHDTLGRDNHLVVLVTGAGMSMWGRPGSAGIPWTNELVTYAAWWAVRAMTGDEYPQPKLYWTPASSDSKEPCYQTRDYTPSDSTAHANLLAKFARAAKGKQSEDFGLPEILGHFWSNGFTYAPKAFNRMFGPWSSDSLGDTEKIELFRQAFEQGLRLATTLHDQGVTRQHRVAAQLSFDLIITTNFDGLHERAALTVASSATKNLDALKVLARGIPWEPASSPKKGRSSVKGRLVRLYGSVWHGESLAFERTTFEVRQGPVLQAIDEVGREKKKNQTSLALTLVVVGHGLHEDYLPQTLREVCEKSDWCSVSLVLVNPDLKWAKEHERSIRSKLLELFRNKNPERKLFLAEGRALDFFYDLRRSGSKKL